MGIDPSSGKVRYLRNNGIKLDKFDTLRNDFDACMTLFQDFIKHAAKSTST